MYRLVVRWIWLAVVVSCKSADPPSIADARVADDATAEVASACSLVGKLTGFGRETNALEVRADGTGSWRAGANDPREFRWRIEGTTLVFHQSSGWQAPFVCAQGTAGRYRLRFDDGCATVHLTALEDACTARRTELDGSSATRVP